METTMQLLEKALKREPTTTSAEWCRRLGVNRTALHVARARGRLTPTTAAGLAILIGENANKWFEIATLESEPDTPMKRRVSAALARAWPHS